MCLYLIFVFYKNTCFQIGFEEKEWKCEKCTFVNQISDAKCKMCNNNIDSHTIVIKKAESKEQKTEERKENKIEKKSIVLVKDWLTVTVDLPEYFDAFINEGYDDMITITETIEEQDLIDIGIQKRGHRKKILLFIKKYKNKQNNPINNNNNGNEVNVRNAIDGQIEGAHVYDTAK